MERTAKKRSDEINEAGENDLRPSWPDGGMVCNVTGCGTKFYVNLTTYWGHWKRKHLEQLRQLYCPKCPHKSLNKSYFATHLTKKHKIKLSDLYQVIANAHTELIPNKEFIPPGTQRCPKRKSVNSKSQMGPKRQRMKSPLQDSQCNQDEDKSSMTTAETDVKASIYNVSKDVSSAIGIERLPITSASQMGNKYSKERSDKYVSYTNETSKKVNISCSHHSKKVTVFLPTEAQNISVSDAENEKWISDSNFIIEMEKEKSEAVQLPDKGWHECGIRCHVPACGSKHFDTINSYQAHWKQIHSDAIKEFKCLLCSFKYSEKLQLQRHLRLKHKVDKAALQALLSITKVEVSPNEQYIDPGTVECPKGKAHDLSGSEGKTKRPRLSAAQVSEIKKDSGGEKHSTEQIDEESMGKIRPAFVNGMYVCPVKACPGEKYDTYYKLCKHWKSKHEKYIKKYNCPKCSFQDVSEQMFRGHLRNEHHLLGDWMQKIIETACKNRKSVENTKFIDPGDCLCPTRSAERKVSIRKGRELVASMPDWVEMPCPVQECGDHHYTSHASFISHWKKKHTNLSVKFECSDCSIQRFDKTYLRHHLQYRHHYEGEKLEEKMTKIKLIIVDDGGFSDTRVQKGPKIKDVLLEEKFYKGEKLKDKEKPEIEAILQKKVSEPDTEPAEKKQRYLNKFTFAPGMPCPVWNCSSVQILSYSFFEQHWIEQHALIIKKFACTVCDFKHIQNSSVFLHVKTEHCMPLHVAIEKVTTVMETNRQYVDVEELYLPELPTEDCNLIIMIKTRDSGKEIKIQCKDRNNPAAPKAEISAKHEANKEDILGEDKQEDMVLRENGQGHLGIRIKKAPNEGGKEETTLILQQDHTQKELGENMKRSDYKRKGMSLNGHKEGIHKAIDTSLGDNQAKVNENVDSTCDTNGEKVKKMTELVEEHENSDENIEKKDEQNELINTLCMTENHSEIDIIGKRNGDQSAEEAKNKQQKAEEHLKQEQTNGKNIDDTVQHRKDVKLNKFETDELKTQMHQGTYSGHEEQKTPLENTHKVDVNREDLNTNVTTQRVNKSADEDIKLRIPATKNQAEKVTTSDTSEALVESQKWLPSENQEIRLKSLTSKSPEPVKVEFVSNMSCPIDKCGTLAFTSLSVFEDHWSMRHLPVQDHFKCRICNFGNSVRSCIYMHIKNVHGMKYYAIKKNIYKVHDKNRQFLDPGPFYFKKCLSEVAMSASAKQKKEEKDSSNIGVEENLKPSNWDEPVWVKWAPGMDCPVDKCTVRRFASWQFFCPLCSYRHTQRSVILEHIRFIHKKMDIMPRKIHNTEYIDPGRLYCVELGEPKKESTKALQEKQDNKHESKSTSQKESRKIAVQWKYNMTCPVCRCGLKIYDSWTSYCQHWKMAHEQRYLKIHACPKCSFQSGERFHLVNHMKQCHNFMGRELSRAVEEIKCVDTENPSFIDPGNYTCNWFGKSREKEKSSATGSSGNGKTDFRKDSQTWADTKMIDSLSFHEEEVENWKEYRIMCTVPKFSSDVFLTQNLMQYHWKEKQTPFLEYFHCQLCGERSPQRRQLSNHLFLYHSFPYKTAQEIAHSVRPQKVANCKYVNPGRQACPVLRPRDCQKGKLPTDQYKLEKAAKQSS